MSNSPNVEYRTGLLGKAPNTPTAVLGDQLANQCALMVPIATLNDADLETYRLSCLMASERLKGQMRTADAEIKRRNGDA